MHVHEQRLFVHKPGSVLSRNETVSNYEHQHTVPLVSILLVPVETVTGSVRILFFQDLSGIGLES